MSLYRPITSIREDLNRLFYEMDREWFPVESQPKSTWAPPIDIWEEEETVGIRLAVPGYSAETLDLAFEDNTLTLQAEKLEAAEEAPQPQRHYLRREIRNDRFHYAIKLPMEVAGDQASAQFENGLLTIRIPKSAQSRRHKIQIG